MRDSARPKQLLYSSQGSRASSPLAPLSRNAIKQYNAAIHNDTEEESSEVNGFIDVTGSQFPWGLCKSRSARGDLVKSGRVSCTSREIDLAVALTATAWITGQLGLDWLLWPEEDPYRLGDCVLHCWEAVEKQQELDGYESHQLEDLVARKVSLIFFCTISSTSC